MTLVDRKAFSSWSIAGIYGRGATRPFSRRAFREQMTMSQQSATWYRRLIASLLELFSYLHYDAYLLVAADLS